MHPHALGETVLGAPPRRVCLRGLLPGELLPLAVALHQPLGHAHYPVGYPAARRTVALGEAVLNPPALFTKSLRICGILGAIPSSKNKAAARRRASASSNRGAAVVRSAPCPLRSLSPEV